VATDQDNPFSQLLAAQQKNVEALTQANRIALEGIQAVARRQMEFFQQAMGEAAGMARDALSAPDPQGTLARQADVAKKAFDQSIANMRELADMLQKSNREAVDIVNQRIATGLDEFARRVTPPKS
jgi:phasin family protein